MKKALLCGLSAAMLLALVLVACNKPQADQPDPVPTPSAVQTQPPETPQPEEANEPANQVEQMSVSTQGEVDTRREATLMDLLDLFQTVYDCRADWISLGETEEVLELLELEEVNVQVEANRDVIFPADIQNQYLTWKAIYYGTTEPVSAEQQQATDMAENSTATQPDAPASNLQQLFTECNQIMYATGTVNIRASYSTSSDKLGTLYRGMSVTCIGIGIGEAEGWNMVILENGNTAYMVGSYLSTQKPEMNIVTGGGGGTTQTNTGTGGTGGTGGPGGTGGGLAVDVTGGKSPMDFMGETEKEKEFQQYIDENTWLDMSKVGFGN